MDRMSSAPPRPIRKGQRATPVLPFSSDRPVGDHLTEEEGFDFAMGSGRERPAPGGAALQSCTGMPARHGAAVGASRDGYKEWNARQTSRPQRDPRRVHANARKPAPRRGRRPAEEKKPKSTLNGLPPARSRETRPISLTLQGGSENFARPSEPRMPGPAWLFRRPRPTSPEKTAEATIEHLDQHR